MSTIRKAYMEISNGIRGLRFHRDQTSTTGGSQGEPVSNSSSARPSDDKSSPSLSKTSKQPMHLDDGSVSAAVSKLFPSSKSAHSSSTYSASSPSRQEHIRTDNDSNLSPLSMVPNPSKGTLSSSPQASVSVCHKSQTSYDANSVNGKQKKMSKDNIFAQTKLIGSPKAGIASRIRKLNLSITGQKWTVKAETIQELALDDTFLNVFFFYFPPDERRKLCQVCKKWKSVLYHSKYWVGVMPVINFKEWGNDTSKRKLYYEHFHCRGFEQMCLVGATDKDVTDMIISIASSKKNIKTVCIRCSNISDGGLESIVRKMPNISKVELSNCNEVTGSGLWACLNPRITALTITDCIHIADDTIGAIAQLLPSLYELNLQAYHVTDNGLALFDSKLNSSLRILRLKSCWEITNHGIVNIIHSLPNITYLSLSGCSKITDDGIEIIAENMKKLKSLDISWCSRVTDASLEYVACDLGNLEELVLDRCTHVTDIGIGYISTMTPLSRLFIRWCVQVGDFGLHHIFSMRNLRVLSIAGCRRLTSNGLYGLRHLQRLQELEVTNCPGANSAVCRYLKDNMPNAMILE
ncbi:F-box/LRR-repeat protein 16 [Aplysia californica]|uniref:F-box/LRR-repeat protein 16 n=1 Tax=Aplysia californica TaxID=6500 RepID=A0ABM0JNV5_APLCA|nr:F-box/LRR-repeat protein 16 [Aplysia californica]